MSVDCSLSVYLLLGSSTYFVHFNRVFTRTDTDTTDTDSEESARKQGNKEWTLTGTNNSDPGYLITTSTTTTSWRRAAAFVVEGFAESQRPPGHAIAVSNDISSLKEQQSPKERARRATNSMRSRWYYLDPYL